MGAQGYYTSMFSGEEIDAAVAAIRDLMEVYTIQELLQQIADLESRIEVLEGG